MGQEHANMEESVEMQYSSDEEYYEHADYEYSAKVDRLAEPEQLAVEEKMLYCFGCHTGQLHLKCVDDERWQCPNCGMKRKNIFSNFEEILAALQESDFSKLAERGTRDSTWW